MIGDKCPLCKVGTVRVYNTDKGFYCDKGCILFDYFKKEKQTMLMR